ncbi:MAG: hypothetical protein QOH21_246 [Acidobacteriota bacterium]|nr:hypothetical protein [Acidobacteriota bacterium]
MKGLPVLFAVCALSLMLGAVSLDLQAQCYVTPEGSITNVSEPDQNGDRTVTVEHTNGNDIQVVWQGTDSMRFFAPNPYVFTISTKCMSGSSGELLVKISNCAGFTEASGRREIELRTTIGALPDTGTVSVTAEERGGVSGFHVTLTNPFMTITKVRSLFFPVRGDSEMGQDGPELYRDQSRNPQGDRHVVPRPHRGGRSGGHRRRLPRLRRFVCAVSG